MGIGDVPDGSFHMKSTKKFLTPPILVKFGTHVGTVVKFIHVKFQTCELTSKTISFTSLKFGISKFQHSSNICTKFH